MLSAHAHHSILIGKGRQQAYDMNDAAALVFISVLIALESLQSCVKSAL
jgi:hypothetical protein